MKKILVISLLLALFTIKTSKAQKLFHSKHSFGIGIGATEIIPKGNKLSYTGFAYTNQYTRFYEKLQINCRVNFLITVNLPEIGANDTSAVEKWRQFNAQSIDVPICYALSGKTAGFSIGFGPTIRHRISAIPNLTTPQVFIIDHEHKLDMGLVFNANTFVKIGKRTHWNVVAFYTAYNNHYPTLGLCSLIGYQF